MKKSCTNTLEKSHIYIRMFLSIGIEAINLLKLQAIKQGCGIFRFSSERKRKEKRNELLII
jgi:hypothetical protein